MTATVPRILLFGSTGQVGWELQRALQPLGDVVACSRGDADFENPESLRRFFTPAPDVVVNAVAYTAVDLAEKEADRAETVNAHAVAVLAEEARRCGALLVHYSTDYVFDGAATAPYVETDATGPRSVYGRTKLAGEEAIRAAGGDHVILRTSWVYTSRGKNFLRTILRLAAEREQLRIVGDQRGAPTSARLIADATAQIVARSLTGGAATGTFHLTASGETSWHGFATFIVDEARAAGWNSLTCQSIEAIATSEYPVPAPRPAYSKLDTSRVADEFGLVLPDWTVGVRLCLAELAARP